MEPAGRPSSFHGVLACLVCSSDLFLFQYAGPACLKREAPLPLPDKVIKQSAKGFLLLLSSETNMLF